MREISRILFLCVAVVLGACTRDIPSIDEKDYDPAAPVRFVTDMATRGAIVDTVSKMTTMGVFCSYTGTTDWTDEATLGKMFNQQLNYNSGKWEYPTGQEVYWGPTTLTDRYTFFAYAPYGTGAYDTSSNSSGNGLVVSGSSASTGAPSLTYTVPVKVENQPDLMVAVPRKNIRPTGAAVALEMKHALTSVAFQIAGDGEKVKGIAVKGVSVSGTLAVDGETVTWSGLGAATDTDFSASLNYDEGQSYYTTTETMSTNLIAGDGYLMMIPQTLTADAKVVVTMDDDTTKELTLGTTTWTAGKLVTYNITMPDDLDLEGGQGDIMYFDTSDGNRLKIGRWNQDVKSIAKMVFTQFGSVIGFTNNWDWDSTASILFNPTATTSYDYASIPRYNAWNTSVADSPLVSNAAYHNGTNIKAGRGDICKLVGLTAAEVQAMSAQQLDAYKSGWRLPTKQESYVFIGAEPDYGSSFNTSSGYYTCSTSKYGIATFLKNKYYSDDNPVILPLAGARPRNGSYDSSFFYRAYYWTSTPAGSGVGYDLLFNASILWGATSNYSEYGYTVRCVPTGETPTPVPEPIPDGGVIAPPGVIGYIKGTNTLTIRGSKEYSANPDIAAYATQIDARGLETETVYVAYFKSGSLVALSSDPNDETADANGHYFQSADIIAAPNDWKGSLDAAKQYIGTSWGNIPVHAGSDNGSTISGVNSGAATGDPCIYHIGSGWTLPKGTPYNGYSASDLTWKAADALGTGIPAGGLSTKSGETGIFYPAVGHRDMSNGQVGSQDTSGFFWSDYEKDSGNTYYLHLSSSSTGPFSASVSNYGYAVRCVRASTITVSPTTATFEAGGETQQFTVTATNFSDTPGVSQTTGTDSWLSATITGSTLSVTAAANTGSTERTATITLTAGSATAKLIVSQGGGPTISVSPTTATFGGAQGSQQFTVTTTNFTGTPTVDQTPGTSWVTATVSGSTLSVAVSTNTATPTRTATITLTAGTATATMTVTQYGTGGENHVLYLTGDAQYPLKVGRWETSLTAEDIAGGVIQLTDANNDIDRLALFKFGSVIGFNRGGDFTLDCIKFNPSNLTVGSDITCYDDSGVDNTLPSIPGYSQFDYDNNILNVSDRTTYHTEANIRAGKGDPCRLAGIDMTRLDESGYLANYNSGWHLPSPEENQLFIGILPSDTYNYYETSSVYYQISPSSGWTSTTFNNGIFPANTARAEDPILPVTFGRGDDGKTGMNDRTSCGVYWSNTVYDDYSNMGVDLFFDSNYVMPVEGNVITSGCPIRCVRD